MESALFDTYYVLATAEYTNFQTKHDKFHSGNKAPKQVSFALGSTEIKQVKVVESFDFCTQLLYLLARNFQAQKAKSINYVGVSFTTN